MQNLLLRLGRHSDKSYLSKTGDCAADVETEDVIWGAVYGRAGLS